MQISKNFKSEEIICKCGCGKDDINKTLVDILQRVREAYGKPIKITSGVRCKSYNETIKGTNNSSHTRGNAVDIYCDDSHDRYKLVCLFLREGIDRLGLYENYIHVDLDENLYTGVIWINR